jgi:putative ABC transport system permease protein
LNAIAQGLTLDYHFLDDDYQALYTSEQNVSLLSRYFAGIAIVISCLGLFGLVAFSAERRMKEIGIRKILGSTSMGIVYLLSSDFTKMVLISIFLALPISYFMTKKWLDNFAYKTPLELWYFIGAGLIALLIAWITIGMQTIKASRINPTQCLRDE